MNAFERKKSPKDPNFQQYTLDLYQREVQGISKFFYSSQGTVKLQTILSWVVRDFQKSCASGSLDKNLKAYVLTMLQI